MKHNDGYVRTNFVDIPNPEIDTNSMRICGTIRNNAASHSWLDYAFIDYAFVRMSYITFELCMETLEQLMIITLRDGEEVNEIYRGEDAQRRFDAFYLENYGKWRRL